MRYVRDLKTGPSDSSVTQSMLKIKRKSSSKTTKHRLVTKHTQKYEFTKHWTCAERAAEDSCDQYCNQYFQVKQR
jgi:hypothetical protein